MATVTDPATGAGDGTVTWTYSVANSATQYLAVGQTTTETFTVTISDGHGGMVDQLITVTITGTNDAPVISAAVDSGSVTADVDPVNGYLSDTGTITFDDIDLQDGHSISVTSAAGNTLGGSLVATITDPATGTGDGTISWTYSVANSATQYLAKDQTTTETFTVTISDGQGGTVDQLVTVTITGTNDAPTISAAVATGDVTEDATTPTLSDSGTITFDDIDLIDVHSATVAKNSGTLGGSLVASVTDPATGAGDGTVSWTYSVANSATQYLAHGQTVTESFTVLIDDGNGGTTSQVIIITITGANEAPVISAAVDNGAVTEDVDPVNGYLSDTGTITFDDVDLQDTHSVSVTSAAGNTLGGNLIATITDPATGVGDGTISWTYSVANSATQYLAKDQTTTETFTVTISDGQGGTVDQLITVTITGTNDAPTITAGLTDAIGAVTEDATTPNLSDSGSITFNDIDLIDTHLTSVTPLAGNTLGGILTLGTVSEAASTEPGTVGWTYSVANSATQYLAEGQTVTETFTVTISDGQGGTVDQLVTVTITGTNDAPTLDLDFDNSSTATGANYYTTYAAGSAAVSIADSDILITDVDTSDMIESATITLTNAQAGDVLTVGSLPAGITANVVGNVVMLSGSADRTAYELAIAAVSFSNTLDALSSTNRTIEVVVNDGDDNSNTATTTIDINPYVTVNIVQDMMSDDQTSQVTFTFSEAVTGFTQSDLTVTGGTISMPVDSGDHINWTATFTPTLGYTGAAEVTVNNLSYTDLAGNAGSSGSDTVYISPISYDSTDTGWLMNYSVQNHSFDMKVKGGSVTLAANGVIYWDIMVEDSNGDASLSFDMDKFPTTVTPSYTLLYNADGTMMFRVYLTAIESTTLDPTSQMGIEVLNASGDAMVLNADEFVRPHSSFNVDYSDPATFDTGTAGAGVDYDWLSPYAFDGDDVNGGEFSTGTITLQTGVTQHYGDSNDIVYGTTGHDELFGDAGHDFIAGRAGSDILHGGDGDDTLVGGYGNEVLYGDAGADSLYGNESNDTLTGGLGNDILTGGSGADIFKWTAADITASGAPFTDTITDFSIDQGDKLDLTDVLTGEGTDLSSYLDVHLSGSNVEVSVYANGVNDGTPDMNVVIQNPTDTLTELQQYLQNSTGVIH